MLFAAAYAPPFRASIVPPALNRTMTAMSLYAAAAPCDRPVAASSPLPLGVASKVAVNDPFCEANAVFWNPVVLVMQPGAGPVTVMVDVPLCPSLVAVIVAEPAVTPVTSPLPVTVATDALLLLHVPTRPDKVLPLASWGVAVSCTDCPASTVAEGGVTLTDATATVEPVTVTFALSDMLPGLLVATTWNEPQRSFW